MRQRLNDIDAASLLSLAGKMRKTLGRGRLPTSSHAHHADILHTISSALNHARHQAASTVAGGQAARLASRGWSLGRIAGMARETANAAGNVAHSQSGQLPQAVSIAHRRALSNIGAFAEPMLQRSSSRAVASARGQFQSDAGFGVRMLAIGGYVNLALSAGLFLWGDHLREMVAEHLARLQAAEAVGQSAQWARVSTNPNAVGSAAALEIDSATVMSGTTATTSCGASTYSTLSSTAPAVAAAAAEGTHGTVGAAASAAAATADTDARAFLDIVMALASPHNGMLAADAGSSKKRWRSGAAEGPLPLEQTPLDSSSAPPLHTEGRSTSTAASDSGPDDIPFVGRHSVPLVLARCIVAGAPSLLLEAPLLPDETIAHALHTLQCAQAVATTGPCAGTTEALLSALGLELGHRVATRGVGGPSGVPLHLLTQAAASSLALHGALAHTPGTMAHASATAAKHGPEADSWAAAAGIHREQAGAEAVLPALPNDSLHTHTADVLASARDLVAPGGSRGLLHSAAAAGHVAAAEASAALDCHEWGSDGVAPSLAGLAADALSTALQAGVASGRPVPGALVQQAVHALHDMRVARIKGGVEQGTPVAEQALSLSLLNALGSLCDEHALRDQSRSGLQMADVYPLSDDSGLPFQEGDAVPTSGESALEQLLGSASQAASDVRRQTLRLLLETQALPPLAPAGVPECNTSGGALMGAAYCSVSGPQRTPAAAATAAPSVGMHTRSHAAATAVRVRSGVLSVLCSSGDDAPVLSMPLRELALLARLSSQGGLQRGNAPPQLAQAIAGALGSHAHFVAQCGKGDMGTRGAESVAACADWAQAYLAVPTAAAGGARSAQAQRHAAEALVAAASIAASSRDWAACQRWLAAAAPHSHRLAGSKAALASVRAAAAQAQRRSKNSNIVQLASKCVELVQGASAAAAV